MAYNWTTEWPGVYAQHTSQCPLRSGGDCTCGQVSYRASAKAPDERRRVLSPEFGSAVQARDWLRDQRARVTAATAVADEGPSVSMVIHDFLAAATRGRARGGAAYSDERLRQVREGLTFVEAELGPRRIQAVRRRHVQAFIDQLDAAGMPAERVAAVIGTLRVLFVYAIKRDLVDFTPIVQLRLPESERPAQSTPLDPGRFTESYDYAAHQSHNGNGNGNGNGNVTHDDVDATRYAPAFTAPFAPPLDDAIDDPFDDWAPPAPVFGHEPHEESAFDEPPMAAPRAPWVASDPLEAEPYPAEPYPAGSTFAPPAAAMPTAPYAPAMPMAPYAPAMPTAPYAPGMPPPAGAATHYGTPTYGIAAATTQVPAEAPAQVPADSTMFSEQMFWWITRIVVIVFVLIALVLAAESV